MQKKIVKGVLAAAIAIAATAPAHAEAGDWLVRLRAILVAPQSSSSGITPAFPAEHVRVGKDIVPELDFTYMWSNHIGTELILGTSKNSVYGRTGTTGSIGKLASTYVLPPTLTLQYHFNPEGSFRPYLGVGANYTIFYSAKASKGLNGAGLGDFKVHMKDSFGYALQGGFDIPVGKRSFVNLDLKYIDMDTDARLTSGPAGTQRVRAHIDPIVAGIGFGMRF